MVLRSMSPLYLQIVATRFFFSFLFFFFWLGGEGVNILRGGDKLGYCFVMLLVDGKMC